MSWNKILLMFLMLVLSLTPTLAQNPVWSVILFMMIFLLVAILLISLNIEFLAFIYAIVYIGAVAVLFLFMVMLLNVTDRYHVSLLLHLGFGLMGAMFFITRHMGTMIMTTLSFKYLPTMNYLSLVITDFLEWKASFFFSDDNMTQNELHQMANRLYSLFDSLFMETSFILLVALMGVIVLTQKEKRLKMMC